MMKIDPGAIGFTSGFSQEHKYSTVGECYLLSTALVFPEEEGMMQQSSVSISLSFENQGINPVGGYARAPRTCTKQINHRNQRGKGLTIPTRPLTRVRSDRYDEILFLVFL